MGDLQSSSKSMNEAATSTPSTVKPKRSKKPALSPEQKIEALEQRQRQLAEQIKDQKAKISAKKRKQDTRRKIVAGAIALEHMEHDENFKNVMEGLLKRHVKDTDQHLFET